MDGSSVLTRHSTVPIAQMAASRAVADITSNQAVDIRVVAVSAAAVATTAEDMAITTMETVEVVQATAALAMVVVMAVAMVCPSARCRQSWYLQRSLEPIYTQLKKKY